MAKTHVRQPLSGITYCGISIGRKRWGKAREVVPEALIVERAQYAALISVARTFVDTFTTASGSCLSCTGEHGEHEDDCDIGMFARALSGVESSDEGEADGD